MSKKTMARGRKYNTLLRYAAYAATKSALQALMLSLKNEIVRVAPYATVNIVAPGWIWTHMMDEVDPAVVKKSFQTRARLGGSAVGGCRAAGGLLVLGPMRAIHFRPDDFR